jgi:hypothetical protein
MTEPSPTDLLILPLLLTFFGALVYGLVIDGNLKRRKLTPSRWVGVALIALALVSGFPATWELTDSFKRTSYGDIGKKMLFAHYGAGLIPLIALLVCLGVDLWSRRRLAHLSADAF